MFMIAMVQRYFETIRMFVSVSTTKIMTFSISLNIFNFLKGVRLMGRFVNFQKFSSRQVQAPRSLAELVFLTIKVGRLLGK